MGAQSLLSDEFKAECPNCGKTETFSVTPLVDLGVSVKANITVTDCSDCGYKRS